MCSSPKSSGSVTPSPVVRKTPTLSVAQMQKIAAISEQALQRKPLPQSARTPTRLCARNRAAQAKRRSVPSFWMRLLDGLFRKPQRPPVQETPCD